MEQIVTKNSNKSIETAEKLINIILEHMENTQDSCEHCKRLLKGVFE